MLLLSYERGQTYEGSKYRKSFERLSKLLENEYIL